MARNPDDAPKQGPVARDWLILDSSKTVVGDLTLNSENQIAYWKGRLLTNLTLGEFRIVRLLANKAGHNVTYREIYDIYRESPLEYVGEGPNGYKVNVRAAIRRVRKKFREVDEHFSEIENYPNVGYRWGGMTPL